MGWFPPIHLEGQEGLNLFSTPPQYSRVAILLKEKNNCRVSIGGGRAVKVKIEKCET